MAKQELESAKPRVQVGTLGAPGAGKTTLTAALSAVAAMQQRGKAFEPHVGVAARTGRPSTLHIEYTSASRQYTHVDFDGGTGTKELIAGAAQLDAAILVVSLPEGIQPQTREQVLLARSLGVGHIVVFLNKADLIDDPKLVEIVELEVRELLLAYELPGNDVPVVVGSAARALEGEADEIGVPSIVKLIAAMDTHIPVPVRPIDGPFLMAVEDAFDIKSRGTIVVGRIERGVVRVFDAVDVVGLTPSFQVKVVGIEMFRKPLDVARAGDNIGLVIEGSPAKAFRRGQVICESGTVAASDEFESSLYVLTKDEDGRDRPFPAGYRPQFHFRNLEISGVVHTHEAGRIRVQLASPVALEEGQPFTMREADKVVGTGTVTRRGGGILKRPPLRSPVLHSPRDPVGHPPPTVYYQRDIGLDRSAARTVNLLFVTTRKASEEPEEFFSGERAHDPSYGKAKVRVPEERKLGTVKLPFSIKVLSLKLYQQTPDPRKHFILQGLETLDRHWWLRTVTESPVKQALVFVHGFNVSFLQGIYRCAQIAWDIDYGGIPILFSWASRGKLLDYGYDRNSALIARDAFVGLLSDLRTAGVEKVHVLAHSMGNFAVLEALAYHNHVASPLGLGELVMAAPDVDSDQYLKIAPRVRAIAEGMTLYASSADKAMKVSRKLAGEVPRAGDVPETGPFLIPQVDAIDVTAVGEEILGLNHGVFATGKSILNDVKLLLSKGIRPPADRLAEIRGMPEGLSPSQWWRYVR